METSRRSSGEAPADTGKENHLLLEAYGAAHAVPADLDRDGWLDVLLTSSASPRYRDMDGPALIYWGSPGGLSEGSSHSVGRIHEPGRLHRRFQ